jgi:hypothetical protein
MNEIFSLLMIYIKQLMRNKSTFGRFFEGAKYTRKPSLIFNPLNKNSGKLKRRITCSEKVIPFFFLRIISLTNLEFVRFAIIISPERSNKYKLGAFI